MPPSPAVFLNRTGPLINEVRVRNHSAASRILLLCLACGFLLARPAQAQQPSSWSGVVRTAAGQPVAGATVVLTDETRSVTVITRPDGTFSFPPPAATSSRCPASPTVPIVTEIQLALKVWPAAGGQPFRANGKPPVTGPVRPGVTGRRGIRDTRCGFTASAAGAMVRNSPEHQPAVCRLRNRPALLVSIAQSTGSRRGQSARLA